MSDTGLRHVQCESCHGPGGEHVADPRRETIVRTPPAVVCRECHNEKHSDMADANYDDYRRRILHAVRRSQQDRRREDQECMREVGDPEEEDRREEAAETARQHRD